MKKRTKIFGKLLVSYLLASIVLWLYMLWPHYGYNAHAPFSGFPALLVYSPSAPFFIFEGDDFKTKIIEGVIFLASFALIFFLLSKKQRS